MAVQYRAGGDIYGRLNVFGSLYVDDKPILGLGPLYNAMTFVSRLSDFPAPVNNTIFLESGKAYFISTAIDLSGRNIVAAENSTIIGASSEVSVIRSTGKSSEVPLISSRFSLALSNISFQGNNIFFLSAAPDFTQGLDWRGVSFANCNPIGYIKNYANMIYEVATIVNSSGLTLDGNMGTVGFNNTLFDTSAGSTMFIIPSSASFLRRFRIIFSAFVTNPGETGINMSLSASLPADGYILDNVNFSGDGTYLSGVDHRDNKSLFFSCKGIQNSSSVGQMTMTGNLSTTVIPNNTSYFKISGNTSVNSITQKFAHINNRLTYTGAIQRNFKATAVASMISNANNELEFAIAKNGQVLSASSMGATTNGNGDPLNATTQGVFSLSSNDYLETFVRNNTGSNNILVSDLNVIIETLGG